MAQSGLTKVLRYTLQHIGKRCYTSGSVAVPLVTTSSISYNHAAKALLWNSGHKKYMYSTDSTSKHDIFEIIVN